MHGSKRLLTVLILIGLGLGCVAGQWLYDPDYSAHEAREQIKQARAHLDDQAVSQISTQRLIRLRQLAGAEPWHFHKHGDALRYLYFIGNNIFMKALKMLIIPLVMSSVIVGVISVGDFSRLGRIGLKTMIYYFATMFVAVTIGLVLVNAIRPGDKIEQTQREEAPTTYRETGKEQRVEANAPPGLGGALLNIVDQMIPANPIAAAAAGRPLPVICFSLLFGVLLTMIGPQGRVVGQFFEAIFEVMMRMVGLVLWMAPVGVFCLVAWSLARIGFGVFATAIGTYMLTVLSGLGIHAVIILPLLLWIFSRTNPWTFFNQMRQALATAGGTASSSATLPVTIRCAEDAGVSKKAAGFVLPLGATINMDGTALYEAVAVVFLAQAWGVEIGLQQNIIIALTATLAAVGAAGIPEAGLVTMAIVVAAVNQSVLGPDPTTRTIPLAAIGLIIGVDRVLDMCRTSINVWGDAVGAMIISRTEPDETVRDS
ncbi:MAG TPA: dicarboxylate/amino acid:cation symporter [Phycisphaerae bacterium]|nr:dicarboxylate/amino acid:cation symporter [Phycisphaerae bacterium]